jgi:hypothetical protein
LREREVEVKKGRAKTKSGEIATKRSRERETMLEKREQKRTSILATGKWLIHRLFPKEPQHSKAIAERQESDSRVPT